MIKITLSFLDTDHSERSLSVCCHCLYHCELISAAIVHVSKFGFEIQ